MPALSSSCVRSEDSSRGTARPIMTCRSEGDRPWLDLSLDGSTVLGSRNRFPVRASLVSLGDCLNPPEESCFVLHESLLLNAALAFFADRSFSRALHSCFRSFKSTKGTAFVSSVCFFGGVWRVKSVTRLSPTGFPVLLFVIPRILCLELSPGRSRRVRLGDWGERLPLFPDLSSSFCLVALTRKSKGRFRSNSRSSAEEHEELEISSVMGDDRGKAGKAGSGTRSSGCGFCRLEVILLVDNWIGLSRCQQPLSTLFTHQKRGRWQDTCICRERGLNKESE